VVLDQTAREDNKNVVGSGGEGQGKVDVGFVDGS
jgi:hypothetical protein